MYTGSVFVLDGETAARQTQTSKAHTGATPSPRRFICDLNLLIWIIITGWGTWCGRDPRPARPTASPIDMDLVESER